MKSILTSFLAIAAVLGITTNVNAQVADYAFSQSMGTYVTINQNNDPTSTGVTPRLSTSGGVSSRIQNIGLPFDMCFNGTDYNIVSMHSNGYIKFASTISPTSDAFPISNQNNIISAFGADLEPRGTSVYGLRFTGVQVGSAPFRFLTFQWGYENLGSAKWRRVGFSTDELHFQIVLYETTNVIETRYYITTARNGSAVTGVQVGLRGANATDFNNRRMTSNGLWLNNNLPGTATNSTMRFGNGTATKPNHNTSGTQCLVFRWTPQYDPTNSPNMTACYYSPLPVELSEFSGEALDKVNKLRWTTTTEHNSDYFIVEHSLNGGEWDYVGRVNSVGNSTTPIHYELEDRAFESSTYNFYRLKQVDIDGKTKTYNMIYVDNRESKKDLLKTVNLMGQEVGPFYQGMVIDVYSDGTTEKYYKN